MTDEKTKAKSGVTVSKEAVFIGDFEFKFQGNLIKQYKEWKDACNGDVTEYEQTAKELMAKHYAFYGQFQKENKYVKRGSILWCSGGSKMSAFDILNDHGVEKAGSPIGICTDCKANQNIDTFGSCKKPTPEGYPERPAVIPTVKSQFPFIMHKCIPMLNGSWSKTKSSKIKIWDESAGKYVDAITTGDFLTCFYGGIIEIVEVPTVNETKGSGNKLAPGTGGIGPKGTALLIDYENLGEKYKVYENGKLVAILSRDVEGKGNITYGYGILFKNTEDEIKRLKINYGLEFSEKVRVPINLCETMYQDYVNTNLQSLNAFTIENLIWLNQNQLDALIMHRHLTYRLGSKTQATLIEMFKDSDANDPNLKKLYWDNLFNAMLGDLKDTVNDADYKIYKDGWTSRILDELELFFDGDEIRNH
jgi:hypothetical protein